MAAAMGTLARGGVDTLADLARGDARSDFLDRAGQLGAGNCRQRRHPAIGAGANVGVRNTDADRMGADQNLAGLWFRDRYVENLQDVRRPRLAKLYDPHRQRLFRSNYCGTVMCASLITRPQSCVSSPMNLAASAMVPPIGSSCSARSLATISGFFRIASVSRLILSASAGGRPGGPASANQVIERKPGSPCSAIVGTLGSARSRSGLGDAEDCELAGLEQRDRRRQRVEKHVDVPAHQIGERRLRAVIRHVDHVDAGEHFQFGA